MKTIKANNFDQAVKAVEELDKELSLKVKENIPHADRKHYHVLGVKIENRPGEAKNKVSFDVLALNADKFKKLNERVAFMGFSQIILLHDPSEIEEEETPVLHLHDEQKIEARVRAELEAKHQAEMDELKAKYKAEAIEKAGQQTEDPGTGGEGGQDEGGDDTGKGGNDDVNVLEVYAEELDANVDQLKEFAKDNEIDLSGLKNKKDIQIAIGTWLHEQKSK